MAALYDVELNHLLDQFLPMQEFVRRQRPSDPRFDRECRDVERQTRRLERAFAAASCRASATTVDVSE